MTPSFFLQGLFFFCSDPAVSTSKSGISGDSSLMLQSVAVTGSPGIEFVATSYLMQLLCTNWTDKSV